MPFVSDRSFHRINFGEEKPHTTQQHLQRLDETIQTEVLQPQDPQKYNKTLDTVLES
jgi:hypothetical protein